jgi:hypothetical protein
MKVNIHLIGGKMQKGGWGSVDGVQFILVKGGMGVSTKAYQAFIMGSKAIVEGSLLQYKIIFPS